MSATEITSKESESLSNSLLSSRILLSKLQGVANADKIQLDQITKDVAEAKGRLSLSEEISRVFEALQNKALERSVGSFQTLLTAILSDVLPDEGNVRLIPEIKNNNTWLDIMLEKAEGELEDILDGNGGAMTNVISAGLRYVALSRTKNRRLMVLDEPDCWIKPGRVPAFINVINEISTATKTQSLIISHHDYSFFEGVTNIVKLKKNKETKQVVGEAVEPFVTNWESDDEPGIRAIELINFRAHTHTFLPLRPGATTLVGDNNLGKSAAVVSALKAVCYGESTESVIKHKKEYAKVILYLENNLRVEWSRHRTKSPAVSYRLLTTDENGAEVVLKEGRPKTRNSVPDWVSEILRIEPVDDMDIQVGSQKSPVFLLDESGYKRSQILSVGKESSHLKTFMKNYESLKATDRETVKYGEASAIKLRFRQSVAEPLESINDSISELVLRSEDIIAKVRETEQLESLISVIESLESRCNLLSEANSIDLPIVPKLEDTDLLLETGKSLSSKIKFEAVDVSVVEFPTVPQLVDTAEIAKVGTLIGELLTKQKGYSAAALILDNLPEAPVLAPTSEMEAVLSELTSKSKAVVDVSAQELAISEELSIAESAVSKLKESLKVCPLCSTPFNAAGGLHTHE